MAHHPVQAAAARVSQYPRSSHSQRSPSPLAFAVFLLKDHPMNTLVPDAYGEFPPSTEVDEKPRPVFANECRIVRWFLSTDHDISVPSPSPVTARRSFSLLTTVGMPYLSTTTTYGRCHRSVSAHLSSATGITENRLRASRSASWVVESRWATSEELPKIANLVLVTVCSLNCARFTSSNLLTSTSPGLPSSTHPIKTTFPSSTQSYGSVALHIESE
mmetsp:Transcript_815/g.1932  ORF Transcript_815/g.1932 Transcript_815/m.1932 type:complete len:217 (+) Transcript_815:2038-2688(+)